MLDNHAYNLMEQLVQEHKSLWRMKKHYSKDAGSCRECKAFWAKMKKDKLDHIREIKKLLQGHKALAK